VVGVIVALAAVRPSSTALPRRPLLAIAWVLGIFMVVRAIGVLGFGFVGDALLLAGVRPPPVEHAALARDLARWDLVLWSPFFLVWGSCWIATGWRLATHANDHAVVLDRLDQVPRRGLGKRCKNRRSACR
jgi:hypothetical protein